MKANKYDTVTKPALNKLGQVYAADKTDTVAVKTACDAAAAAGATRNELTEAIGGVTNWNVFVGEVKAAGLA